MPNFIEITCKSACTKHCRKNLPYTWDLNIYRGCEHQCKYCYALYSHTYLHKDASLSGAGLTDTGLPDTGLPDTVLSDTGLSDTGLSDISLSDFFDDIYVKTNIVQQLDAQLSSRAWKRSVINIGSVCDTYQAAEAKYQIMPEILRLLIKYKTPCIISTKSDLILRDFDLVAKLAKVAGVNLASTITVMNEDIAKKLEPKASSSANRFAMLNAFAKTKVIRGLHCMPIIPKLTDSIENIDELFARAKASQLDYVLPGSLYLHGQTRNYFLDFIKQEYPDIYLDICKIYGSSEAKKAYKAKFYPILSSLKNKYQVSTNYLKPISERIKELNPEQSSLLDLLK